MTDGRDHELVRREPGRSLPARAAPGSVTPGSTGRGRSRLARVQAAQPARAEPGRAEPGRAGLGRAEPAGAGLGRAELSRAGPGRAQEGRGLSGRPRFTPALGAELTPGRAWPLQSYLELAAFPGAVTCLRLHTRQLLWEWGLRALAENAELIVSELTTNAVSASADVDRSLPGSAGQEGLACIALLLASDRKRVLVNVWDSNPRPPARADCDDNAESGRGLAVVEELCGTWDWHMPKDGRSGKWVRAIIEPS